MSYDIGRWLSSTALLGSEKVARIRVRDLRYSGSPGWTWLFSWNRRGVVSIGVDPTSVGRFSRFFFFLGLASWAVHGGPKRKADEKVLLESLEFIIAHLFYSVKTIFRIPLRVLQSCIAPLESKLQLVLGATQTG